MTWPYCTPSSNSTSLTLGRLWDDGITWFSERTAEPTELPLTVEYVRDKVLRVANGSYDDERIERLISAATEHAEHMTQRALMPQTWALHLSGFPSGGIVLPRPPLIEVVSFGYFDAAGDVQTLAGSPSDYRIVPSGHMTKAQLWPLQDASWPSALGHPDSLEITYRAGYETRVPEEIIAGICILVSEMYKQTSLSVQGAITQQPSILQLERFFRRVY